MAEIKTLRLKKIKCALINVNKQTQRLQLSNPNFKTKAESLAKRLDTIQEHLKDLAGKNYLAKCEQTCRHFDGHAPHCPDRK